MATDAQAPCVSRTWKAMALNKQDKWILFCLRKDFDYLCYLSVDELQKTQIHFYVSWNIFHMASVCYPRVPFTNMV